MSETTMSEATKAEVSTALSGGIAAEIDAAVTAAMDTVAGEEAGAQDNGESPSDEPAGSEGPGDDERSSESPGSDDDAATDEPEPGESDDTEDLAGESEISEELLERAVRAGISLSEAKQFPSPSLLENMVSRIEGPKEADAGSRDDAGESQDDDEVDVEALLSAIPDLDPDEVNETIVDGFKSLKEIIRQQSTRISELSRGRHESFLATQLDSVKEFTQGDPAKVGAVREKFDVLKAGYKAAGKGVTEKEIFDEAARLVLGAEMAAAKLQAKGQAARRRSGQRIARPTSRRVEPKPDVDSEVAAMLDRKFGA